MFKIDISTIRQNASSLITLNDGYLLYQSHDYSDVSLLHDSTLNYDFVITANFKDVGKVTLYVGEKTTGNCKCMEKGLCKHEVALFFLLKDKVLEITSNKDEYEKYESSLKVDRLLNNVYQASILPVDNQVEIYPTVVIEDSFKLFLDAVIDNHKFKVKDMNGFFNSLYNNLDYTFNFKTVKMSNQILSVRSTKLINLVKYLEKGVNTISLDLDIFDDIYNLFPETINVYNGYYSKPYSFTNDSFILNMTIENGKLSIIDTNYVILSSIKNDYIFYKEKIYVTDNHCLSILLNYLKNNSGEIIFNKDSYRSFLVNIYPYVMNYIEGVDYCYDLSINSYINYENKQLSIKYETDIEDELMFIKRTNYLNFLKSKGFNKQNNYSIDKYDDICEFIEYHLNTLSEYGEVNLSRSVMAIEPHKQKDISFNLKINGGMVEFLYNADSYSLDDINKMILAYKAGNKYVVVEGETVELNEAEMKDITAMLDDLEMDRISNNKIKLYQAYYLSSKYKKYIIPSKDLDSFYSDMVNYNDRSIELSPAIKDTLREYQLSGVKWLYTLSKYGFGGILADDMGLGKTLQIISLIEAIKPDKPVLIVSPTSLIYNWDNEFRKFAPNIKRMVMYDEARSIEKVSYAASNNMVMIISYETLRIDIEKYKGYDFSMCIIDEAQFIKNPDALKTLAVKSINSRINIALTGTPIENSLVDLWSIFDFVLPGYLGKKSRFISRFEGYNSSSDVLSGLNKRIQPFMLRRLKTDVLDLEDKIETISYSFMSNMEKKLYQSYLSDAKAGLEEDGFKLSHVLSVLTRLRQLACEPRLFLDNLGDLKNSKMSMLMEIIEEKLLDNHKILVFSQFTSIFPYMEEHLNKLGIKYLKLTGQTKSLDRAMLVEEFNTSEDIKVFLISLKAGGTGLNLTSADTVIHYDPWWNNAVMNQATDRAYRIGQTRIVHEIKLVAKNTIEEKIVELENKKKYLFDSVISDDDIIKKITLDDLKELFQ